MQVKATVDPKEQRLTIDITDGEKRYTYERKNRGAAFEIDLAMLVSDMLDDLLHNEGAKGLVRAA